MKSISIFFGRMLLAPISWIPLSRLYGRVMRLERPRRLAQWMIGRFQKHYRIDMDGFQGEPGDYRSLADYFLRPLNPHVRPLETDPDWVMSPADGCLCELEFITEEMATQVKGWTYPISLLLAENIDFKQGWHVATIYLSPKDYHRFHYPLPGRITGAFHGGASLFPVNGFSVNRVRSLYIRNERLVTRFALQGHPFYVVAVGATFVGSIAMTCLPAGLPAKNSWCELDIPVAQMAEMGRFSMGSTIIMVVPAPLVKSVVAEKGKPVRVGAPLFKINEK